MVGAESQRAGSGSGALSGGPGSPRSLSPQRQDKGDGSPRLIVRVCAAPGRSLQLTGGAASRAADEEGWGGTGAPRGRKKSTWDHADRSIYIHPSPNPQSLFEAQTRRRFTGGEAEAKKWTDPPKVNSDLRLSEHKVPSSCHDQPLVPRCSPGNSTPPT